MLGKGTTFIFGLFLASITFIVGIIFPPLWLGTLLGFCIMIAAPFKKNGEMFCNGCNYKWKKEDTETNVDNASSNIKDVIPTFLNMIKKKV
jgi:hypothetical protein